MGMTNAERQALWRQRQREKLEKLEKRKPGIDPTELRKLKARIRELEAELARERARKARKEG
jgi:hypothetical protein